MSGEQPLRLPLQWPLLVDSAWRALAYCFHPRVIWWSLLPLVLVAFSLGMLGWWGWADGVAALRQALDHWGLSHAVLQWLDDAGLGGLRTVLVPLLLVALAVPLVLMFCLMLVAGMMTPRLTRLVLDRRLPALQSRYATPWWAALAWSLGSSMAALLMMLVTSPLWLFPWLGVWVPPLIWGWLTYRVMAYDCLADVATPDERKRLMHRHRRSLLAMGVVCGYAGAAPAAMWALGAWAVLLAPILIVVSVWVYMLVFAYASLWFAHYLLPALDALRRETPTTLIREDEA